MSVKSNTTLAANITTNAREQDFVTVFGDNWEALRAILGVMRPIRKAPGTKLVASKASVALQGGSVSEGDEIPYSLAQVAPVAYADVSIEKYAKAVSIEAVAKYGAAVAVQKTDDAFRNELQNAVLNKFYTFMKTGIMTSEWSTFQMALSMAKASVLNKFQQMRKTVTDVVAFVNLNDFYAYIGAASISVQTMFGMSYVKDFMGYNTIILLSDADMPRNMIVALPVENIDLYYIDPSDSDFAQLGLEYTVQGETNLIGFHAEGNYSHAVGECYALMGMALWAEYLDGIAVAKVVASGSNTTATFTSAAASTTDGATKITVTSTGDLKADRRFYVKAQATNAPATLAYGARVDNSWTEIKPNLTTGIADEVTGFTSGHKMVMCVTNGYGQVIAASASGGVTVVVKA